MGYVNLRYKPSKNDLVCSFRVEPNHISYSKAAEAIAEESSIGTWTDLKTMKPSIQKIGAKVFEIHGNWIKIAYPSELFENGNMPQIMSSIGGNIFGMKALNKLRLEDIKWPENIMKSFMGPKFGIQGVRKILKIKDRPLVGTIVKPKLGLSSKQHAKVAYEAWIGGLDLVKSDENLTSQKFNRFENNVKECLKMRDKAEQKTGERKIYVPNVTAETKEMIRRAKLVEKEGGKCAMIDIITTGWSALQTLRNEGLNLILHGHRAGHGAFTRGNHGISMLVVADIARLLGIDQLHIGTVVGKMIGEREEVLHIEDEIEKKFVKEGEHTLEEDWGNIKPVFAICSGGLHAGLVSKLIKLLGKNIIIQAGGGIHGHPKGTKAGALAMRQALEATLENITLKEYAKEHKELMIALKKWS
ncbi:MAG: type III ribulose-bisphosphate carboxylase [Candidatus Aenigmarchaeota archaeon]|nr:type III ribulose-bisphosphate carboxylase [Candidatus Aenigmarchaeota archaeon]